MRAVPPNIEFGSKSPFSLPPNETSAVPSKIIPTSRNWFAAYGNRFFICPVMVGSAYGPFAALTHDTLQEIIAFRCAFW